ncbi:MAG TPA: phospholipid carrier-dependent glycosyltransferase [Rhodocyclaceae bacterium]|nr:phospholipid carrier-dependent glycosyltransferase [Rhodocyclaceae bacterium]
MTIILHFWGLSRFNGLIFDEVYFPKYAQAYLDGKPFFDGHPPLGKYLIALGLWLSEITGPLGADTNTLTGAAHAPWAYRWVEALAGSMLPVVMAGIAWQLSGRWRTTLLAALLTCLDGLLLVESRYGLINIFLILFGLLGHYFYLRALDATRSRGRLFHLAIAGIFLGACVSVKWNGLSFLIVLWALWMLAYLQCWWHSHRLSKIAVSRIQIGVALGTEPLRNPFTKATQLNLRTMLLTLLAIPLLVYVLQWQPHLRINKVGFFEVHRQLLQFHEGVKDGPSEHPYCSRWYTWPVIARPMSYLFTTRPPDDPTPYGPPLEKETPATTTYAVHALGNPLLWWLVVPTMIAMIWIALRGLFSTSVGWLLRQPMRRGRLRFRPSQSARKLISLDSNAWVAIYLSMAYAAGILPWIDISRCTFIYHYLPSVVFGFLACAFGVDRMLSNPDGGWRLTGAVLLVLIVAAFIFWLPLFLGLPISREAFYSRMWFNSWI